MTTDKLSIFIKRYVKKKVKKACSKNKWPPYVCKTSETKETQLIKKTIIIKIFVAWQFANDVHEIHELVETHRWTQHEQSTKLHTSTTKTSVDPCRWHTKSQTQYWTFAKDYFHECLSRQLSPGWREHLHSPNELYFTRAAKDDHQVSRLPFYTILYMYVHMWTLETPLTRMPPTNTNIYTRTETIVSPRTHHRRAHAVTTI